MKSLSASKLLVIAHDEWRYWFRSKLAMSVLITGLLLTISSVVVTAFKMHELDHARTALQSTSDSIFMEQPDRHPHRMVHYGHYAFRTPSPLSMLDPGVDAYTGNSIFLEGHRQNSAMFAEQKQGTGLTTLGKLSPAFVVQILAPMLLILVGYSAVSRERESQTLSFLLAQGTSQYAILGGKFIALFSVVCLIVLPFALSALFSISQGESPLVVLSFIFAYLLYLSLWALCVVLFSTVFSKNSESFTALTFIWVFFCIAMPRIASSSASVLVPATGKIETDFAVIAELRKLGDGHNANDPAFKQFRQSLLEKYNVDKVEDLPVNFRGMVARRSEAQMSQVLNRFAEDRMKTELEQTQVARAFGWLSPQIAIRTLSMLTAGTGIETHHRFIRETENLRLNFVQSLNEVHIKQLSYKDDINRNKGKEGNRRARVSSENWQMIEGFEFDTDKPSTRLVRGAEPYLQLVIWVIVLLILIKVARRRLL